MNTEFTKIIAPALLIICASSLMEVNAQNVGISNTAITPHASSILELRSTTGGFLMPRMSEIQKNAISSPATGLIIYQTNGVQGFYTYDGSAWVPFGEGVDNLGNHTASQNLEVDGHWLSGDGDNEGIYVDDDGNVGLGTSSPEYLLDVDGPALLRGGGTNLSTNGTQILLGYNGQDRYMQGIRTRHQSGYDAENAIDFYTWDQGTDGVTDEPTKRVMTIDGDGSGKIGIGTAFPQDELHITGTSDVEILLAADPDNINDADHPKLKFSQDGGTVQGWVGYETDGANDNNLFISNQWNNVAGDIRFRTRNINRMTIDGDGKMGLGTTDPVANMHLYGNGTSGFTPGFGAAGPEIGFSKGGFYTNLGASIQMIDYNGYSAGLCFNVHRGVNYGGGGSFADNWPTDVIQAMTIENNGNVGIGSVDPEAKLHVEGDARISDLAGSGTRMVVADADGDLSTQAIPSGGGGSSAYGVNGTGDQSTSSSSYGNINDMSLSLSAGTYILQFNAEVTASNSSSLAEFSFYVNGGTNSASIRTVEPDNNENKTVTVTCVVTVNYSQTVSTRFRKSSGSGSITISNRCFTAIQL